MKLPIVQDETLRQAFSIMERMDSRNYKTDRDLEVKDNRIILTAPNGTRYALVVNNSGVLSTVVVV